MRYGLALAAVALSVPEVGRAQCTVTATPVSFGIYVPFSAAPADSTGTVTVRCRFFGPYMIGLNAGLYGGGSFANRRMNGASSHLTYQLYTNPTRHTVWGDGTGGTLAVFGLCAGLCSNPYTIYGRVPARQVVRPGNYVDTITVTVTF